MGIVWNLCVFLHTAQVLLVPPWKVSTGDFFFLTFLGSFPLLSCISQYLQRRQQENTQRQSRGEPPLPEEDISKMFKPPQAPPRMDTLLIAGTLLPQPFPQHGIVLCRPLDIYCPLSRRIDPWIGQFSNKRISLNGNGNYCRS